MTVRRIIPSGLYLHHIEGDLRTTPNAGTISGFASPYVPAVTPWTGQAGTISGAVISGFAVEFANHPVFYGGTLPGQWGTVNYEVFSFDWTVPQVATPTAFDLNWLSAPAYPEITVYELLSPPPFALPTTYTGTSILVVPSPAPAALIGGVLAMAARRSRRAG
ncbi:MAG: hypothetical protein R3B68_13230 [Phycisphaerales bacterium]